MIFLEEIQNVNDLVNLLKNEKKSGEIITLPNNFYLRLSDKEKEYGKGSDEYKNIVKLVSAIKERRLQKLLIYVAYNKEIPRPIPSEEEDLYTQIKKILNKNSGDVKTSKLKVSRAIPEIITPSGNKIGPFEQNEIVYIYDLSDVKFMVDNKLGEIMD